jgi:hypothetical protein
LLTASDFADDQVHIHWALSYFKSRHAATFSEHTVRQEMWMGKMAFTSCDEFTAEFTSLFCPENKSTTALMRLESEWYFQARHNVEAYIDEFKNLIDLSGYTDSITIVLNSHRVLIATTQDCITESGTDRPRDNNFHGWFKAMCRLDLNCLANEAVHYASHHPSAPSTATVAPSPSSGCTAFSFHRPTTFQTAETPTAMHTPSRALPPGIPMDVDHTRMSKNITPTCYQCGQSGHISKDCDLWHMTLDEQDKFIQNILANCDAAMAATAESMTLVSPSKGTLVEHEVNKADFIRSSG